LKLSKKAGSWFSYGETKLGQGRDAVKSLIKDNPELADELEAKIKERIKRISRRIKLKRVGHGQLFFLFLKTSVFFFD
jgi:polyhydroxyalkanoate synthesis regulator phasin